MTLGAEPLAGITVVDLGQWMAGPTAARILADNGAVVIHVDPPGGWRWSAEADAVLNHGKRRFELDFEDPDDLAQVHHLIATADVVIENFRPGALARFGLDEASVRARQPDVVYLSLPGFASTDQEHAQVAAYEAVIASATGQFSDMGVNRVLMGVSASYSPLPLGSAYAGVFGAMAVGLALRARLLHGLGEHIEVPIASSLLEALAYNSMHVENAPSRYLSRREQAIRAGARGLGYGEIQALLDPFYRTYRCADDRPLYLVAVSHRRHPRTVLEVLGLWEEAVAAGIPTHDPYMPTSQWPPGADWTLLAHPVSAAWAEWLSTRIGAALSTRRCRDWEDVFASHGIPAIGTRTAQEWLITEHALASGLLFDVDSPRLGRSRLPGPALWTEAVPKTPAAATGRIDPAEPVRAAKSVHQTEPDHVDEPAVRPDLHAGWLDGITVVDLTNVIAGPTIGSTLARYGARVIKVDLPQPTFDPWNTILCGLHSNRGKESMLLDARSDLGLSVLRRLLARADVLTVNASEQQLARLGLTGADLAEFAPQAILSHLDAWGGPAGGPWRQRPGYDDLVQAATGIMTRFGGGLDTPEEHAHFGTIDVLAGLAAATATAFALYAREATGRVLVARSSLAAAGQLISAPYMCGHAGPRPHEPSGPQARGESPTYGLHATSDGWAFLVVPPQRLKSLSLALGADDLETLSDDELDETLATLLREHSGEHSQRVLAPLGVTVQPLRTLAQQRERHTPTPGDADERPWSPSSYHFTTAAQHAAGRAVTLVAPVAVRPRHARIVVPADAPKYGEHTTALLAELGYDAYQVARLLNSGAASTSWSDEYLPN